mmetsp:Transcript_589/g.1241  ORF Transcript_589/g.1241 Transcript_589/m.1241 type:complete len:227 (-) Transcript_589:617-1297(-)
MRPKLRPRNALPPYHGLLLLHRPVHRTHPLHPIVEQAVRRRAAPQALRPGIYPLTRGIVEVVPLPVESILGVGGVVSESNVAPVVRYGVEVVERIDAPSALFRIRQIPIVQWVLHRPIDFGPLAGSAELESLQVHDEYGREGEQIDLFRGIHVTLASIAVPSFVPSHPLLLAEFIQAGVEGVAVVRYREGQVHEGIELDAYSSASSRYAIGLQVPTGHGVAELALE